MKTRILIARAIMPKSGVAYSSRLKKFSCLAVFCMLFTLFLLPQLGTRTVRASGDTVVGIARALPCAKLAEVEDVSPGNDLFRIDLDLSNFPNAVCNDGTPATMFVRRYAAKADKNKWVIFLLHITTPMFIRFDLQDRNVGGHLLDSNLATAAQFGQLTHDQLSAVVDLDRFAEEGSVRSGGPRLRTPGVFGPQCTDHYGLSVSKVFFGVAISDSGKSYRFHDVLWNWVQGLQPQQVVHNFVAPGPAPDCP